MRASGILLPIFSIDSPYGIGCFSKEAYSVVDFLEKAGQKYWQILPLGPTSYGDSPYQSFSTFAGNPYFIDLDELVLEGVLTQEECKAASCEADKQDIDYGALYENRMGLLRTAYSRSRISENPKFQEFCRINGYWLKDYAVFMAVKQVFGGVSWDQWAEDIRYRWRNAMEYYQQEYYYEVEFYEYLQFLFDGQWKRLKEYANKKDIQIIGDIPIYVAFDSADVWANPELFQLDGERMPTAVAGCPPDGFSATGQLWGNPLYRWETHRDTGYDWWIRRMEHCCRLYDVVRIDHFRGFDEYYSIPAKDETAENGHWVKGPGIGLFHAIKERLGDKEIIAEDLGYMTPSVKQLVKESGYPGMKVLEFAFDSRDSSDSQDYLPHNYPVNSIVYTGTHDNETVRGWLDSISRQEKNNVRVYLNRMTESDDILAKELIRLAHASVARLCVIPIQDYMGLDNSARINRPSTLGLNWKWRLNKGDLSERLAKEIRELTELYER